MKTITVTKQEFMKATGVTQEELQVYEDKFDNIRYKVGVSVPLSRLDSEGINFSVACKLTRCFNVYQSISSSVKRIFVDHEHQTVESDISIEKYIETFGSLKIYLAKLSGDKYCVKDIEIRNVDKFKPFVNTLCGIDKKLFSALIDSIDIDEKVCYMNSLSANKLEDMFIRKMYPGYITPNIFNKAFNVSPGTSEDVYKVLEDNCPKIKPNSNILYTLNDISHLGYKTETIKNDMFTLEYCEFDLFDEPHFIVRYTAHEIDKLVGTLKEMGFGKERQ